MGEIPCVVSRNWLATCLVYYFPFCSAGKSCVCGVRLIFVEARQVFIFPVGVFIPYLLMSSC
jgi:hypothetical protein